MTILYRDYETRSSTLDVSDVGAWRYATHPETEIQCCAFAVDDEPVKLWVPGDPVPPEFIEAAQNPDWLARWTSSGIQQRNEQNDGKLLQRPHVSGDRRIWRQHAFLEKGMNVDIGIWFHCNRIRCRRGTRRHCRRVHAAPGLFVLLDLGRG
jgi:hypothetical protein